MAKSSDGDSMYTTAGALAPVVDHLLRPRRRRIAKFDPVTNEIGLENSISAIGQHDPNIAMFSSSRIGISWLASNVNEPTRATTPSSAAWRPQLASSFGIAPAVAEDDLERAAVDAAAVVDPLAVDACRLVDVRVRRQLRVDRRRRSSP